MVMFLIKRIVVAGCRNYNDYSDAKEYIDFCIKNIKNKYTLIFISGGCAGADSLGKGMPRKTAMLPNTTLPSGINTENQQDLSETKKWLKSEIMSFVFGTAKAGVQNL